MENWTTILICLILLLLLLFPWPSLCLDPVEIQGQFFVRNGKRFVLKGLAYQPTFNGQYEGC